MPETETNITWPVVVVSGKSTEKLKSFRSTPETFSEQFGRDLPEAMNDLATIYTNTDGASIAQINSTNLGILSLCKFMLRNGLSSLSQFTYSHVLSLKDFMRREYAHAPTAWRSYFLALGRFRNGTALENLFWPRTPKKKSDGTKGHSMHAYIAIGNALFLEIERIRRKAGRLENAKKTGKILTLAELDFVFQDPKLKQNPNSNDDGHWITRDDCIRTILHYLPGWPVLNRESESAYPWLVYESPRGRCLRAFRNKVDAEDHAKQLGQEASVVPNSKHNRQLMNPGQLLLYMIKNNRFYNCKHPAQLYAGTSDCNGIDAVVEYYFPTLYDYYCIYLFWIWLTGWNSETVASVAAHDLGFGVDITKTDPLAVFTADHVIIKGVKTRGQTKDNPKDYTYISDKNDPHDLYCVLKDFYALTKPIRGLLTEIEKACILVGVAQTPNDQRNISKFGPSHSWINNGMSEFFFKKHHIYDDMQEFNFSSNDAENTEDPILVRVKSTNGRILRTTWETWLKESGVSLTQRMIMMGHASRRTTNTDYGGELLSIAIRHRQLRVLLNNVEEMAFKGNLRPYQTQSLGDKNKIVQIFVHKENEVFYCKDPFKPTWPGHESYVDGQCSEFDECLLCEQCVIIPESLPVLVKWEQQIRKVIQVGPMDIGDKRRVLLKAIHEIFDLCRSDTPEWLAALENGFEMGLDPDFVAPEFNYRYGVP